MQERGNWERKETELGCKTTLFSIRNREFLFAKDKWEINWEGEKWWKREWGESESEEKCYDKIRIESSD